MFSWKTIRGENEVFVMKVKTFHSIALLRIEGLKAETEKKPGISPLVQSHSHPGF